MTLPSFSIFENANSYQASKNAIIHHLRTNMKTNPSIDQSVNDGVDYARLVCLFFFYKW